MTFGGIYLKPNCPCVPCLCFFSLHFLCVHFRQVHFLIVHFLCVYFRQVHFLIVRFRCQVTFGGIYLKSNCPCVPCLCFFSIHFLYAHLWWIHFLFVYLPRHLISGAVYLRHMKLICFHPCFSFGRWACSGWLPCLCSYLYFRFSFVHPCLIHLLFPHFRR